MNGIALHPDVASTLAPQVDLLFYSLLIFSFGLGIFLTFLVVRYAIRYRRGSNVDRSGARSRNLVMEVAWTSATTVIAFVLFGWGAVLFVQRDHPPRDAIEISGIGRQWMWQFEHAEGRRELNELHVPVGKPVIVHLASQDVIHSLFIPAFRIKQDAVPGMATSLWFEATKTGTFDLFCAEFCGTQHSEMRGHVIVMPLEDYSRWLTQGPTTQSLASQGETLFRALGCSGCHGPGSTVRAPDLTGVYGHPVALESLRTVIADEAYLRDSILQPAKDVAAGYEPIMPSFDGLIEEADLSKIIAYLKSLSPEGAPS